MTVTKRKQKGRETAEITVAAPTVESGIKATCDSCSVEVTHNVHMRCAELKPRANGSKGDELTCPDFDLCVPCFLQGKSIGPHRSHHDYRVISSHAFPIFSAGWGADEELLLIEGAEMYGLGNWADMAEHVGGRTKEECEQHYLDTYVNSDEYPLPNTNEEFDRDLESFQVRKKARLEELQARPLALPPPKPLASAPTCHEVAGFMPGRLEFETEYENEAETLIKDLEFAQVLAFGGEDQPAAIPAPQPGGAATLPPPPAEDGAEKDDGKEAENGAEGEGEEKPAGVEEGEKENENELELKLTVLEMFNERYDRRMAAKDFIFDRGLMNYRTLNTAERKRTREEKDLLTRTKVFAKVQTSQDYENFADGLIYEQTLRKRISELQDYRRNGVTTLAEGAAFEQAKQNRLSAKHASYRDIAGFASGAGARRPNAMGTFGANGKSRPANAGPLTLANSSSLHLLSPLERGLCATLRILPRPYLFLKEVLLREWTRAGKGMGAREARRAVGRDKREQEMMAVGVPQEREEWLEKIDRVWEFLRDSAGLRKIVPGGDDDDDDGDDDAERMSGVEMERGDSNGVLLDEQAVEMSDAPLAADSAS